MRLHTTKQNKTTSTKEPSFTLGWKSHLVYLYRKQFGDFIKILKIELASDIRP